MIGTDNIEQTSNGNHADERLFRSVREFLFGDTDAFEYIYNSTVAELMGVCRRYTSGDDEAKDILQETYIKIYKNLGKYDTGTPFAGWAKRIAINTAIDHYRKQIHKTLRSIDGIDAAEDDEVYVKNDVLNYDVELVLQAVQELPDGYRIILNLYVLEHKTHKEIAEMLNISESTSRSQLSKARRTLKARFEHESK